MDLESVVDSHYNKKTKKVNPFGENSQFRQLFGILGIIRLCQKSTISLIKL